jgi:hypothetical protein
MDTAEKDIRSLVAKGIRNAPEVPHSVMVSQIKAAVLAERERCAKVAEEYGADEEAFTCQMCSKSIADEIRRGE